MTINLDFCKFEGYKSRRSPSSSSLSLSRRASGAPRWFARRSLPPPSPRSKTKPYLQGDNDPVDLVEIGSEQLKLGGVYKVKPLG